MHTSIVIIEDEKPAARMLERKLQKMGLSVSKLLHSVEESVMWLSDNPQPDLVFLDIQLSDGLSFEIFETIPLKSAVIFTTAYDSYSLQAFSLNSVDYLLKPIDDGALQKAIEKYKNHFSVTTLDLNTLKTALFPAIEKNYKSRFIVKTANRIKIIDIQTIECCYSENKGTYIHTTDNRNYLLEQPLEQLEQELNPVNFFRINRKHIIALRSITDILLHSNSRLKIVLQSYLSDDLIVSRERVNDFKQWLG